jgi:hypothetical protein
MLKKVLNDWLYDAAIVVSYQHVAQIFQPVSFPLRVNTLNSLTTDVQLCNIVIRNFSSYVTGKTTHVRYKEDLLVSSV